MKISRTALWVTSLVLGFLSVNPVIAEDWSIYKHYSFDKPRFVHDHPFAKRHLVVQVSQANPKLWGLVLNNVSNVVNYFGLDKIQVVVVAYGPGLEMLFDKSSAAGRIAGLSAEGVEFDACHNTMQAYQHRLGHLPGLLPSAVVVPGGIVRIMQLEEHGFDYIRP